MTNIFYCLGNLFLLSNKSCLVFGGIFSSFSGNLFGGGEFRGRLWVASAHADSRAFWQSTSVSFINHFQILYFVFVFVFCVCVFCIFILYFVFSPSVSFMGQFETNYTLQIKVSKYFWNSKSGQWTCFASAHMVWSQPNNFNLKFDD